MPSREEVERWKLVPGIGRDPREDPMRFAEDGGWVRFEDHRERVEEAERERDEIKGLLLKAIVPDKTEMEKVGDWLRNSAPYKELAHRVESRRSDHDSLVARLESSRELREQSDAARETAEQQLREVREKLDGLHDDLRIAAGACAERCESEKEPIAEAESDAYTDAAQKVGAVLTALDSLSSECETTTHHASCVCPDCGGTGHGLLGGECEPCDGTGRSPDCTKPQPEAGEIFREHASLTQPVSPSEALDLYHRRRDRQPDSEGEPSDLKQRFQEDGWPR